MEKVLYIVSTLRETGPTNQLYGIVTNIDKNTYYPIILTLSPEPENSRIKDFIGYGVEVHSLNLSRLSFLLNGKRKLNKKIMKLNPDIIHTSGMRADSIISKFPRLRKKHCMTVRNYIYDDLIAKFGNTVGSLAAKKSMNSMNECNYVICCSESLQDKYSKHFDKKLYVIQNGVETKKNEPIPSLKDKMEIRKKLNINENKIIYLVVGSLIKRKDPETIIKAFNNSKEDAELIFLGSGLLETELKKYASGKITFLGNVNNVTDYLQAADYYVSASKSEGLPNSVLEASSAGLELILSRIPQHEEIFENSNYSPNYFEVGDQEKLSSIFDSKFRFGIQTPNFELSEFIDKNFSTKIMTKKYQEMYDLISSNNR